MTLIARTLTALRATWSSTSSYPGSLRSSARTADASSTTLLTIGLGAALRDQLVYKGAILWNVRAYELLRMANCFPNRVDTYRAVFGNSCLRVSHMSLHVSLTHLISY